MVFVAALLSYGLALGCIHAHSPYLNHEELEVYKKHCFNSSHGQVVSEMGLEARGLANGIT